MKSAIPKILFTAAALVFVYFAFQASSYLAASRIYQVDECQNVFVARLIAMGQTQNYFTSITLFVIPLVWLAGGAVNSVDLFAAARLFSLLIFWVNLLLIATATGARLFSRRWLLALIGAATLAPLWDYGFEIRHDNLLLTGLLLSWCALRVHRGGMLSYFMAGALAIAMEFIAFKAFVYTLPLTLAVLVFPPVKNKARWKLAFAWVAGAVGAFVVIRLTYGSMGVWDAYLNGFKWASAAAVGGERFAPWQTLGRLLGQTPLLLAVGIAALIAVLTEIRRAGKSALAWEGNLPETMLVLIALAALVLNPVPHPYNLVNLVPFVFLLGFRYADARLVEFWKGPERRPLIVSLVIFAHFVPFFLATKRHWNMPNHRQEMLMARAEDFAEPARDLVYDGIGMIPTRSSIHFNWFIHSLNIKSLVNGPGLRVSEMLAARPAAVVIQSYRTDWLREQDREFIRENYVPLSDDFWVLGKVLPPGGGTFQIIHPGRYRLSCLEFSNIRGTYPEDSVVDSREEPDFNGTLNGRTLGAQVVTLAAGMHQLQCASNCQPAIVWLGPRYDRVPKFSQGDRRKLFVNWY